MSDIHRMWHPGRLNSPKAPMIGSCWFHQDGMTPRAPRLTYFPTKISTWFKTKLADISEGSVSVGSHLQDGWELSISPIFITSGVK
jgi:hypothetical protein